MHGTLWEPLLTSLVELSPVAAHVGNIRSCKHCEVDHEKREANGAT